MAGQEDWEQLRFNEDVVSTLVWIHKPCGAIIAMALTDVHDRVCNA